MYIETKSIFYDVGVQCNLKVDYYPHKRLILFPDVSESNASTSSPSDSSYYASQCSSFYSHHGVHLA